MTHVQLEAGPVIDLLAAYRQPFAEQPTKRIVDAVVRTTQRMHRIATAAHCFKAKPDGQRHGLREGEACVIAQGVLRDGAGIVVGQPDHHRIAVVAAQRNTRSYVDPA